MSGGELSSLIVALTGVGYFVLSTIRKPSINGTSTKLVKQLVDCESAKTRYRDEANRLRQRVRDLVKELG